ncbi:MAG: LysR family transcriptional regulator [Hormoscilla sp. GM102CHS1]|nr:LysR family transcriptional regulator [Hormoscilla sp. GM102CHS1]
MRVEQLQAFLAVAETGNFQQAARNYGVTQSTISRQIQGLEEYLGIPLFHRGASAKLTIAGEMFFKRARKICQEWDSATTELAELLAGKQPELCVGAIPSVCAHDLPPVLLSFCRDYPQVQLRVTSLGSDRALKVLKDGMVDLAIVMPNRFLTVSSEIVVDLLLSEPIEVLMASNHPLTQYEHLSWNLLASQPQVVFKDGYGMRRLVQEAFLRQNLTLKAVLELNTLDAFQGVVRQGELIALLPRSALMQARLDPTLAVRAIADSHQERISSPPLTREVVLVTTRDRLQIPPIAHFRQLVKALYPQFQPQLSAVS